MITGRIYVSLRREPDDRDPGRDRKALNLLANCPDGVAVVVDLGDRRYVSADTAAWLHDHGHRLFVVVQGSNPAAVATLVRTARAGDWSPA